ncbi:MAG: hypothetical protein SPI25_02425 [Dialister sp.]|nr:hypothetical protein [Dialister sp.]
MKLDPVFPAFVNRANRWIALIGLGGTAIGWWSWGWAMGGGFFVGALFHLLFLLYMKHAYIGWEKKGKDAGYIGRMGASLLMGRLFLEVALAAAVLIWTPLHVIGLLIGLLTLFPASILAR